jgi:hypothetical protein
LDVARHDADDPAYVFIRLTQEYAATHNGATPNPLPEDWVNNRLAQLGATWRVKNTPNGYDAYPASH